ncbi:ATP-binding cassette domain-containing protein, partial [Candidatus Bathyarchaeota archaeon]|nr:ATP-binding cassette domain-containing protein [Candidatus Bathyarchaeota archaeon]
MKDLRTWFELKRWGFISMGFVKALDGVTFDLKKGEAITVVGESGSGKTTLLRTLLGLARATAGEMIFGGRKIDSSDERDIQWLRRQVGFVQQDPYGALPPFMNVYRILKEPLVVNK